MNSFFFLSVNNRPINFFSPFVFVALWIVISCHLYFIPRICFGCTSWYSDFLLFMIQLFCYAHKFHMIGSHVESFQLFRGAPKEGGLLSQEGDGGNDRSHFPRSMEELVLSSNATPPSGGEAGGVSNTTGSHTPSMSICFMSDAMNIPDSNMKSQPSINGCGGSRAM